MRELGIYGEERAKAYLESQGYLLIDRNWRCERGELDIVAMDGKTLVFVEVKARRSARFGSPGEAVDSRKQERLRSLALHYISATGKSAPSYRFDVVAVDLRHNTIDLIRNAF